MPEYSAKTIDQKTFEVLAEILVDPATPDHLQITIMNQLLQSKEGESFFQVILEENLDKGPCPNCSAEIHWLIPEDALNEMNYLTHKEIPGVKAQTTREDCVTYGEACAKRRINF